MSATRSAEAHALLGEVEARLDGPSAWSWSLEQLNRLLRSGRVPTPTPDGFLRGRPLLLSVWEPLDALVRRVGGPHTLWEGKRFDADRAEGVNVLRMPGAGSRPVERFPFRLHVAAGAVDPTVDVLKIDYDIAANQPWLRRVLDELVEIDDGCFLGKVLYRWGSSHRPVGFFVLER
jgi:hypothetical protein